jgi:hypothetical protein
LGVASTFARKFQAFLTSFHEGFVGLSFPGWEVFEFYDEVDFIVRAQEVVDYGTLDGAASLEDVTKGCQGFHL